MQHYFAIEKCCAFIVYIAIAIPTTYTYFMLCAQKNKQVNHGKNLYT